MTIDETPAWRCKEAVGAAHEALHDLGRTRAARNADARSGAILALGIRPPHDEALRGVLAALEDGDDNLAHLLLHDINTALHDEVVGL